MSAFVLCLFVSFLISLASCLQITNVTPPIELRDIFVLSNETSSIIDLRPAAMSYYIDPTDSMNTAYLWYGMYTFLNQTVFTTYIKSDIFTTQFTQYDNNNNINNSLPFTITNVTKGSEHSEQLLFNQMCTSPITNDIFSCWLNVSWFGDSNIVHTETIDCKIFFVKTNIWSKIIQVTSSELSLFNTVLCFDDSYFVPYYRGNRLNLHTQYKTYGTLVDLKGNVIYNNIDLNFTVSPEIFQQVYATKGSNNFNMKAINENATSLFMIYFENYDYLTNITNISGGYGYYTNINDTKCPINMYNITKLNHNILYNLNGDDALLVQNSILDWNTDCCYISIYRQWIDYYYGYTNISALITDIYGNNIDIIQYPNFTDVLLYGNATDNFEPHVIDLPMISTESMHYFMITLSNSTYRIENIDHDSIICGVYYLQYDNVKKAYNFENSGYFETVNIVNNSNYTDQGFGYWVSAYILPQTNYLFFSWEQFGFDESNNNRYHELYGQTFQIN